MSSSAKIVPTLNLGGRFWRLQKEAGQVMKDRVLIGSFGSTSTGQKMQVSAFSQQANGSSKGGSSSFEKVPAWGSKRTF